VNITLMVQGCINESGVTEVPALAHADAHMKRQIRGR